jgi:hypothetical protein
LALASRALSRLTYAASRRRRVALRFLLWSTSKALLTAVVTVSLSLLVDAGSCETRALTDYGFAPQQIVLGVYVAVHGKDPFSKGVFFHFLRCAFEEGAFQVL